MGVLGLWRLVDAAGKPVPLEILEGKILAIDVSIWIHQVLQGYQDRRGNSVPNAHLIGLFNRICKLLYYKIKPVFVFDGGVPMLKKNTIASRRKQKSAAASKAQKLKNDLISNLIKHTAVKSALRKEDMAEAGPSKPYTNLLNSNSTVKQDMFMLPELPSTSQIQVDEIDEDEFSYESENELSPRKQSRWIGNIHSVDVSSNEFQNLPADVRYDILTDLKETRKQNSWSRLHEMPEESQGFSNFQMKRLLKRRLVQESLEVAEKEMGGKNLTLEELEKLMAEQGIATTDQDNVYRIASDSTTRVIYINDKNALKEKSNIDESKEPSNSKSILDKTEEVVVDKEIIDPISSTSKKETVPVIENMQEYDLESDWESETEFIDTPPLPKDKIINSAMNPAVTYMLEYSSLPQDKILALVQQAKKNQEKVEEKNASKNIKAQKRKKNMMVWDSSSDSDDFIEVPNPKKKTVLSNIDIVKDIYVKNSPICNDTFLTSQKEEEKKVQPNSAESDSETDDFVVIEDVPIPDENSALKSHGFEITVDLDKNVEEDMFADVFKEAFSKVSSKSKVTLKNETPVKCINIRDLSDSSILDKSGDSEILEMHAETPEKCTTKVNEEINEQKFVSDDKPSEIIEKLITKNNRDEKENDLVVIKEANLETSQITENSSIVNANLSQSQENKVSKAEPIVMPADGKELESMKTKLENEQKQLTEDIGKLERQATDITEQMRMEAQELLQLFGIPYIVAPMEAEAQCAYLETIKLVDGIITDDSDIWLFGGQCVYKNFFDNNKRVLQFLACDIQHHYKLTRQQMIQLALLVGSDYTNGIPGIGPVTALEILAAFPTNGDDLLRGLMNFVSWLNVKQSVSPGKIGTSLRSKLRNVKIDRGFPSQAVVQAYLFPKVDDSKEKFTWGKPNLTLLADYTKKKFGWTRYKFEEIMNPVIKRQLDTMSQKSLITYFKIHAIPKSIEASMSKRVQSAVQRLAFDNLEDESKDVENGDKKKKCTNKMTKKKVDSTKNLPNETQSDLGEIDKDANKEIVIIPKVKRMNVDECIPQRELNKANALNNKLKAIEVFRKSKKGLGRSKKVKKHTCKIVKEAHLSESDSSS